MHCCCTDDAPSTPAQISSTSTSWPRCATAFAQWAVPMTALALMPKCPACLAAYALLFTGVGMSFMAATAVRWGLITLSSSALIYLVICAVRRWLKVLARS
jgi:hypothetical protein